MERSNTHPHDEEVSKLYQFINKEHLDKEGKMTTKQWDKFVSRYQFNFAVLCSEIAEDMFENFEQEEEEEEECTDENKCGDCTHCARTKVCEYCGGVGGCDEECNADIVFKCSRCDVAIIRDSEEHDNCRSNEEGDVWWCMHCTRKEDDEDDEDEDDEDEDEDEADEWCECCFCSTELTHEASRMAGDDCVCVDCYNEWNAERMRNETNAMSSEDKKLKVKLIKKR